MRDQFEEEILSKLQGVFGPDCVIKKVSYGELPDDVRNTFGGQGSGIGFVSMDEPDKSDPLEDLFNSKGFKSFISDEKEFQNKVVDFSVKNNRSPLEVVSSIGSMFFSTQCLETPNVKPEMVFKKYENIAGNLLNLMTKMPSVKSPNDMYTGLLVAATMLQAMEKGIKSQKAKQQSPSRVKESKVRSALDELVKAILNEDN